MITYITAFIDINRTNWSQFNRSFEEYFISFKPFFKLFDTRICDKDDNMIVFIDTKHYQFLLDKINELEYKTTIRLIAITTNDLPKWKYIEREYEIMNDINFIKLLGNRTNFPEHNYPEYTLINHSKIDLICLAMDKYELKNNYFSWVDFGFFSKSCNIPNMLLDINKLDKNKINYSLINPIERNKDFDIYYTLKNAPEVIGGFWFFGSRELLKRYSELYLETFLEFQKIGISDDDQHLVLQCYKKNPDLFYFNKNFYGWHKILKVNQKKPLKVISFCLWGIEKRYTVGLFKNIELAKIYYPEWICFVYVHKSSIDDEFIHKINKYDNIKLIIKLDEKIREKRFMLWRFEPILLFPYIECFISRDIDTRIQPREVLAVNEWLGTNNKTLHIMRDHPQHYPKILGGMYGISSNINLNDIDWIETIEEFYRNNGEHTDDQYFLYKYVYEKVNINHKMIHDEIKRYEGDECKEFPIKYEQNGHFVGCYIYENDEIDPQTTFVLQNYLQNNIPSRISLYTISLEDKLFFIKKNISNIYIMHYTKLIERKKNMKKELSRNFLDKFYNIKWIEQFDREDISIECIQDNCVLNPKILNRRMTLGEIANGIGHKYIYEQILKNDEIALVLEDDTIFKVDFIHHLYYILQNLPSDWEQICLGGPTTECKIPAKTREGSIKQEFNSHEILFHKPETPAPCTLSCMLHNKKGIQKILSSEYIQKLTAPSDHNLWACNIDKRISLYWVHPWVTYEASKTDMFETSMGRGY